MPPDLVTNGSDSPNFSTLWNSCAAQLIVPAVLEQNPAQHRARWPERIQLTGRVEPRRLLLLYVSGRAANLQIPGARRRAKHAVKTVRWLSAAAAKKMP
jgi:hypothetical protein